MTELLTWACSFDSISGDFKSLVYANILFCYSAFLLYVMTKKLHVGVFQKRKIHPPYFFCVMVPRWSITSLIFCHGNMGYVTSSFSMVSFLPNLTSILLEIQYMASLNSCLFLCKYPRTFSQIVSFLWIGRKNKIRCQTKDDVISRLDGTILNGSNQK